MPKVNVNNINLYYEEYGEGQPIVFIAGLAADHLVWQGIVRQYAQNYRVIVIDNRGVGRSDCPNYPYSIEMMADDIAALCQALNLGEVHFIGNSMGGAIVQYLAYKYPNITKSIVISNSFIRVNTNVALFFKATLELMRQGASPEALIKATLSWVYSSNFLSTEGLIDQLCKLRLANPYPVTSESYGNQLAAIMNFDSEKWLEKIHKPCLVICSDEDIITPAKQSCALAKLIPNAKYYLFEGVGHLPHMEQPEVFNRVVLDFIAQ